MLAVSFASRWRPSLPLLAVETLFSVLPVTVRFSEPLASVTIMPSSGEPEMGELLTEAVPVRPPTKVDAALVDGIAVVRDTRVREREAVDARPR